jgi:DNA modification methylase
MAPGTSIFDPVLCELAYTWFCAPSGHVLDPFAGGSVRGIVAAHLGRKYTGVDLRAEQIAANVEQATAIVPDNMPTWIVGDSATDLPAGPFDFVFSCPPYADLEIYSDNPLDISTMDYADFLAVYRSIIAQSIERLNNDRFACFVVGDVRDKKGNYRNFVSDTIAAFQNAGAMLYNEAILVTAVGSLPIRVGKQFESGRKLGKTHQNVLVFLKGDSKKATQWCGPVEVADMSDATVE